MEEMLRKMEEINAKLDKLLQNQQNTANSTETGPTWLTVREAAKMLKISNGHAYELAKQHALPSTRIGRAVRINAAALKDLK
ncbi:MAG: helix-turn-helix domain-containing protein [Dethiobacter sp.]|nr:helix-turn-helix domain-containing protein [Dethiobacter sp.]MBS3902267.1 helix-turn-helix domain-containing protein [Dethiobacter sp.]MBS3989182.1 helix-turn-helix domain-containing protein [Dethiobacter sp.]